MPKKPHKKTKIQKMQKLLMVPYATVSPKGRDIPLPPSHNQVMQGKKTASPKNPKPGPYEY
jgi:hypothetical protein